MSSPKGSAPGTCSWPTPGARRTARPRRDGHQPPLRSQGVSPPTRSTRRCGSREAAPRAPSRATRPSIAAHAPPRVPAGRSALGGEASVPRAPMRARRVGCPADFSRKRPVSAPSARQVASVSCAWAPPAPRGTVALCETNHKITVRSPRLPKSHFRHRAWGGRREAREAGNPSTFETLGYKSRQHVLFFSQSCSHHQLQSR